MAWKYDNEPEFFVYTCDWKECNATEKSPDLDGSPKYSMPNDWSGVLMTSMSDGDYFGVLCPDHSYDIKESIADRMRDDTRLAVGY
jgi:hypothetical protein